MNRVDFLFTEALADLHSRCASADPYTVLGASALIRKLLIDGGDTLVDQVNRTRRLKLAFEVTDFQPQFGGVWTILDGLYPDTARPGRGRRLVNRDELFSLIVAVVWGHAVTLREIVRFEANVMGGVHAGLAKGEKEKALQLIGGGDSATQPGMFRLSLLQLKGIGRVVVKGLEPLRQAVVTSG